VDDPIENVSGVKIVDPRVNAPTVSEATEIPGNGSSE
jgi:hypothetical protein